MPLYNQGCHILEKSWIFFAVLESPWILLISPGKSWKIFGKFFRDLPEQNVKMLFFCNTVTGTLWLYEAMGEIICIVKVLQKALKYC